ncbi:MULTISPECIES: nuclear transport factor 2 family protein [unclassified Mesorhizobium]|uniref:nuclear transport factor 2 family protein n=1 Tax=unclassified Mesorhizobium TaxID=325217 RepID=UPI001CD0CF64|nr:MULTISPECIES: nuclear transport factor 2 family protein [unclassified Mesorhizobium]MCA0028726.1 nuclear transport factor 2 family protein [Mesorhizobium sp. B263B1A]
MTGLLSGDLLRPSNAGAKTSVIQLKGDGRMDIRSTLTQLCEAFNAHDLDRIMAFFSDDCILEMPRGGKPWGSRFEGKANVRKALATRFEGLPDVHYGNAEHFVDSTADTGISKWTLTGTTREGEKKEVRGCDFYTFRDGKVIRKDSYWKILE